jgi:hypothetical protein
MNPKILEKLDRITDIWNHYIWEYKFCSSKIKFNDDVKTNYFGDLLNYFKDTFEIVYSENQPRSFSDKFSYTISFLQAIYIQQDFVQEMLEIFKTGVDKGQLKQDPTYSINRELRNELVGHPIRKYEDKLISSTLFSYRAKEDEIEYLRYHKDNNFKFESKSFSIKEIQKRHEEFLDKYFDIMIARLKVILDEYLAELNKLENVINKNDFNTILKLVELYFESIFESDFVYDKLSLLKIYSRKEEHPRYKLFIDRFNTDLKNYLNDTKADIVRLFEPKQTNNFTQESFELPKIEIVFANPSDKPLEQKVTYHYEIGKLATKRNPMDFEFFSGFLKSKCQDNRTVMEELKHMELNIFDEIEYYTSLRLIGIELREE